MTKRKPPRQVLTSVRIIHTIWKPVTDLEEALKEANANRLARAKFEQAMTTNDPGIRYAMLERVGDDGTAGALLLQSAQAVLEDKKRKKPLQTSNEARQRARDVDDKRYCTVVDQIRAKNRSMKKTAAANLASKQLKQKGENVSAKTIVRAFDRRASAIKK
jgi:hypothetical protein